MSEFREVRRGIEAQFDSECPVCDGMIFEGDIIVKDDDGDWVHEECSA